MEELIIKIIREQFGIKPDQIISRDDDLCDTLGADSLDVIELQMAVEDQLNVQINDEVFEKIKTVGDLITAAEQVMVTA